MYIITATFELVGVEQLDDIFLPPGPDGLIPRTVVYFHVSAQVFLLFDILVVVGTLPEDQVTGFQFFESDVRSESVHLVCLVPRAEGETEIFSQVLDYLAHECAAIEE